MTLTCSSVRAIECASPSLVPSAAPSASAVKSPHSGAETPWHQDAGYWPFLPDTRAVSVWCAIDPATVNSGCMWFARPAPLARHAPMTDGGHALTAVFPREGLPEPEVPPGSVPPRLPRADAAGPVFSCAQGTPAPLEPGGATLHGGFTPHYTCGNSTRFPRRAYIMNFRPAGEARGDRISGRGAGSDPTGQVRGLCWRPPLACAAADPAASTCAAMVALERHSGFDHGRAGVAVFRPDAAADAASAAADAGATGGR